MRLLRDLGRRKLRSGLTITGIAIGIMALVVFGSMANKMNTLISGGSTYYKDKLVVTQYLGRQIYANPAGDEKDVKYGDVLAWGGKVMIIAINNTLTLMNAAGKVTTVVGPLKFDVDKVLKNEKLYKFLNVPR